jgi:hypothetical protein
MGILCGHAAARAALLAAALSAASHLHALEDACSALTAPDLAPRIGVMAITAGSINRLLHEWPDERDLRFVRRTVYVALRYGDFVAVSLPFLGVSSLNFGPLATAAFFIRSFRSRTIAPVERGGNRSEPNRKPINAAAAPRRRDCREAR